MVRDEHLKSFSTELRKMADTASRRWLLYGTLLLFAHLLDIRPAELDVMSAKVTVADPYIIYGGLSLLFLYYVYEALTFQYISFAIHPFRLRYPIMRETVRSSRKRGRSISAVKRRARLRSLSYAVAIFPVAAVLSMIFVVALVTSIHDVYRLGSFVWNTSPGWASPRGAGATP
jgi:hypothetical protein